MKKGAVERNAAYWLGVWLLLSLEPSRNGAAHSGLGLSTWIIIEDNLSQSWPQASLIWAISQLRFLLPR